MENDTMYHSEHIKKRKLVIVKIIFCLLLTTFIFLGFSSSANASEKGIAGISITLDKIIESEIDEDTLSQTLFSFLITKEEIEVLQRIVEAECTGHDVESKKNVASVILNRVDDRSFADTITDVVFEKIGGSYQFSPISDKRYWKVKITEGTIEAVDSVLKEGVTTTALYFANRKTMSKKSRKWFDANLLYLFTDNSGHSYYDKKGD